jgi:hypothetical protein
LKELETAIKYAYTTRNFNANDFIDIKNTNNFCFNLSWGISSEALYKQLTDEIKNNYPKMSQLIDNQYSRYLLNKNISKKNSINEMLKNYKVLNYNTFIKNKDVFRKYCDDKTNIASTALPIAISILTPVDRFKYFQKNKDKFSELQNSLNIISSQFLFLSKQLAYEFHLCYLILAIWNLSIYNFAQAQVYLNNAKDLFTLNPLVSFLIGICFIEKEQPNLDITLTQPYNNIKDAILYFNKAIDINPHQSEAYLLRAFCYNLMGNSNKYEKDIKAASISGLWRKKSLQKYSLTESVQISINKIVADFFSQINPSRVLKSSSLKERKDDFTKIVLSGYFKPNIQLQKEKIERLFKAKSIHVDTNSTTVTSRRISFK